jgi:hypothetical protein
LCNLLAKDEHFRVRLHLLDHCLVESVTDRHLFLS